MNLASLRKSASDQGFTVIELIVVMIIIGILAAIVIPVFLNESQKARQATAERIVARDYPQAKVGKLHRAANYDYAAVVDFGSLKTECGFALRAETMKCDDPIPAPTKPGQTPSTPAPTGSPTQPSGSAPSGEPTATVTVTQTVTAQPVS